MRFALILAGAAEAGMVEINNREDLEKWLEDQPREWGIAIASRAALRVIPLLGLRIEATKFVTGWRPSWRNTRMLPIFRASCISTVSTKIPYNDVRKSAKSAAAAISLVAPGKSVNADAAVRAATTAAAAVYATVAYTAAAAADTAVRAVLVQFDFASGEEISAWRAIEADARTLEAGSDLTLMPLWDIQPGWSRDGWKTLTLELIKRTPHWQVWIDWYEDRLYGDEWASGRGRPPIIEHERELALIPETDWEKGGQHVNMIVRHLELKYWGTWEKNGTPQPPPAAEVPAPKRAAIEPEWTTDGQLVLPSNALSADSPKGTLDAALTAVKLDLADLISDARAISNIDQRFVDYLERLAARIPEAAPSQTELFRIAHAEENLRGQMQKVAEEWPEYLAVHYSGAVLAFDRVVRQFPAWREFKRNAAETHLTQEEVAAAPEIAAEMIDALRNDPVSEFVDTAIPNALAALVAERPKEAWEAVIDAGLEDLAEDILESISNIFKRLLQLVIERSRNGLKAVGNWIESDLKPEIAKLEPGRRLAKSIAKELGKQADDFAPNIVKLIKRVVKIGAMSCGVVGGSLGAMHVLGWLYPVLKILE